MRLGAMDKVININEPREKFGFAYDFKVKLNAHRLGVGTQFNARLLIHDPELQDEIGAEVIDFPVEGEGYVVTQSHSSFDEYTLPYETSLSPKKLQQKLDFGLLRLEVYQGEDMLASTFVEELIVKEPYYGEGDHWWVSSDIS